MRRFSLIIIVSLILVIIFTLPTLLESQLRNWVETHGGENFTVENIDINPFIARLSLEDVVIQHKDKQTLKLPYLKLKLSLRSLIQSKIHIEELLIQGLAMEIANNTPDTAYAGGILLHLLTSTQESDTTEQSTSWPLQIESLTLQEVDVTYSDPKISTHLEINNFSLEGFDSSDEANYANVSYKGSINGAPVSLQGMIKPMGDQLAYDGTVIMDNVDLSRFSTLELFPSYPRTGLVSIDSSVELKYQTSELFQFAQNGNLTLSDLSIQLENIAVKNTAIHWQGETRISGHPDEGILVDNKGQLNQQGLVLKMIEQDVQLALAAFDWEGDIQWRDQQPVLHGHLELKEFKSATNSGQFSLLEVGSINFSQLSLSQMNSLAVEGINIADLSLNPQSDNKHLAINKEILLKDVEINNANEILIGSILAQGLTGNIHKLTSTDWNYSEFSNKLQMLLSKTEPDATSEPNEVAVLIEDFQIKGALIKFSDQDAQPIFNSVVSIEDLTLSTINTAQPELPIHVLLNATVNENNQLTIAGDTQPFHPDKSAMFTIKIREFPMHPLTSYSNKIIGYEINSGEMALDSEVKVKAGLVDISNKLKFYHLRVQPLDPKRLKELNAKQISSLETGLSMLRDDNNTIELDLPVKGSMDDLQVNSSDIINQAIGGALATGAKTYLAAAIFPYGTLLVVAESLGKKAMRISIDPIIFEPGSILLSDNNKKYLEKISGILKKRPELNLRVCGKATIMDQREPVIPDEILMTLAENRGKVVDDFLINELDLKNNRLISCKAKLQLENKEAKPRVELQF